MKTLLDDLEKGLKRITMELRDYMYKTPIVNPQTVQQTNMYIRELEFCIYILKDRESNGFITRYRDIKP